MYVTAVSGQPQPGTRTNVGYEKADTFQLCRRIVPSAHLIGSDDAVQRSRRNMKRHMPSHLHDKEEHGREQR